MRKRRRSRRTTMEMRRRVKEKKMLEPTGMGEEASMSVI